jgi:outer membrane immunogenic protein
MRSPTPSNFAVDPTELDEPQSFTSATADGCFGGGQVGYNYQFSNNVVVGIEGDLSFGNIRSSFSWTQGLPGDPDPDVNSWESKLTSFGTVHARLGYAWAQWLPYITGGWAWGRNGLTSRCPRSCDPTFAPTDADSATTSDTRTHSGWAIGGGLEYAINENWSVIAEYLHLELGSQRYNVQVDYDDGVPPGVDFGRLKIDTVKVGLNYRFGPQLIMSDKRVKRDIVQVGRLNDALGLYRYRYLWSDTVYVGVMAQEVALIRPDAIVRSPLDKYLRVDYGRLGLKLMTLSEWDARGKGERL